MTDTTPTERLVAAGWTRLTESGGDCAMSSPTVGYCEKSARWIERTGARPMCASHAVHLINGRRVR